MRRNSPITWWVSDRSKQPVTGAVLMVRFVVVSTSSSGAKSRNAISSLLYIQYVKGEGRKHNVLSAWMSSYQVICTTYYMKKERKKFSALDVSFSRRKFKIDVESVVDKRHKRIRPEIYPPQWSKRAAADTCTSVGKIEGSKLEEAPMHKIGLTRSFRSKLRADNNNIRKKRRS